MKKIGSQTAMLLDVLDKFGSMKIKRFTEVADGVIAFKEAVHEEMFRVSRKMINKGWNNKQKISSEYYSYILSHSIEKESIKVIFSTDTKDGITEIKITTI